MSTFVMPSLGADMDEGTLLEWLVRPGDVVHRGDIIAVVDTAKAAVEVETFRDGVIDQLVVEPGRTVPVGTTLATMNDVAPEPASPVTAVPTAVVTSPLIRHLAEQRGIELGAVHPSGPGGRVHRSDLPPAAPAGRVVASPLARRLAREAGLELATIGGTGRDGAIHADDVRRALAGRTDQVQQAPPPPVAAEPQALPPKAEAHRAPAATAAIHPQMRRTIAALMERANAEIPQYFLCTTIDLKAALDWMHEQNKTLPVPERLVPSALVCKAIALAAQSVGELNGEWIDEEFVPAHVVNLGMVTSVRTGGLLVPVIADAAGLSVPEMMAAIRSAVQRGRTGRLRASELTGATITVTSLGDQGVESVYGVVFPPQVAIVGVGSVVERPWAVDGMLAVRPVITVTLAADHRASDGAIGARFLNRIDRLLQHPEEL